MSSWPITALRRPSSTRISRASTPNRSGAPLGVQEVARRHTGVAEAESEPIDLLRPCHHDFADVVVGDVLQSPQVDPGLEPEAPERRDDRLGLAVARAGSEPSERRVDKGRALLDGG